MKHQFKDVKMKCNIYVHIEKIQVLTRPLYSFP